MTAVTHVMDQTPGAGLRSRAQTYSGTYAAVREKERIPLPGSKNVFITTSHDGKPGLERKKLRSHKASELSILSEIFSISSPAAFRVQARPRRRPRHAGRVDQGERPKLDVWEDEDSETCFEEDALSPMEIPPRKTSPSPRGLERTRKSRARKITGRMRQQPCFVREHVSRPPTPFRQEPIHLANGFTQPPQDFIGTDGSHQCLPIPVATGAQNDSPFPDASNAPGTGLPFIEFRQPHISANHAWNADVSQLSQSAGSYMASFMQPTPFISAYPRFINSQYFGNHDARLPIPAPSFVYLGEGQTGTIGAQKSKSSSSIVHDQRFGTGEQEASATSDITRHIQHVHICAGCGKKRSREYQAAHPLRRGEVPQRSYCLSCITEAEARDLPPSYTKDCDTRNISQHQGSCTTREHTKADDRPTSRGFLSTLLSNVLQPRPSHRRKSLSSAEEPSSRLSSDEHSVIVRHRARPHRRNGDHDHGRGCHGNGEATMISAAYSPRAAPFRNNGRASSLRVPQSPRHEHNRDYSISDDDGEDSGCNDGKVCDMPPSRADGPLLSDARDTNSNLPREPHFQPTPQASCSCGGVGVKTGTAADQATKLSPVDQRTVLANCDPAVEHQHSHRATAAKLSGTDCQEITDSASHNHRILMPVQLAAKDVDLHEPASSVASEYQQANPNEPKSSQKLFPAGLESQERSCNGDVMNNPATVQETQPSSTRVVYQQPSVEGGPSTAVCELTNTTALQDLSLSKNGGASGQVAFSTEHKRKAHPYRKTNSLTRDHGRPSSPAWCKTPLKAPSAPSHSQHDKIIEDSLDGFYSGLEYEAEKQAEDELVNAGTNFDEQHSWSGSATSQSALSSILTASVVSIESYTSEDELSSQCCSPHGSYEFIEESDGEDSRLTANEDLGRDRTRLGTRGVIRRQIRSLPHERQSSRQMLRLPSSSPDDFSAPSSSSLIVHSGHSTENFGINMGRLRERLGGRLFRRRTPSRAH